MIFICSKVYFSNAQKQAGQWDAGRQPLLAVNRSATFEPEDNPPVRLIPFLAFLGTCGCLDKVFFFFNDRVSCSSDDFRLCMSLKTILNFWFFFFCSLSAGITGMHRCPLDVVLEMELRTLCTLSKRTNQLHPGALRGRYSEGSYRELTSTSVTSPCCPSSPPLPPSLFPLSLSFHPSPFSCLYERTQSICTTPEKHLILHPHP